MKFKCIRKCFFKSKLFEVGDIYNGAKANRHFKEVVEMKKDNKFANTEKDKKKRQRNNR